MNIRVCDIHMMQDNKIERADSRIGYKGTIKVDICKEHQSYNFGNTKEEFEYTVMHLGDKS